MAKSQGEETVIAYGVRVEGDFASNGDVLIEGEVSGNVQTSSDLRIGENAKIRADVVAKNAVVAGEIRGNLQVSGRLELLQSAQLIGDITVNILSVAAGAQINGKITMDGSEAAKSKDEEIIVDEEAE
ncbi:MAG: polymer-forming cytoskeletal protein [Patescibacteria group bacterium]